MIEARYKEKERILLIINKLYCRYLFSHYSNYQDSLDREFGSIRADTFHRTRSIRALSNVVGMSPLWTIWAGAGRPFSWSTTVLGEEGAHKCWLPLHGRVILRDRSWSRDNCLSIILIILMKLFSKTLANKNGKNVKYFFLLPEQKQKQMMQERRSQKASLSINKVFHNILKRY